MHQDPQVRGTQLDRHPAPDFATGARVRDIQRRLTGMRIVGVGLKWIGLSGLAILPVYVLRRMAQTGWWHIPTIIALVLTVAIGAAVIVRGANRLRERVSDLEGERANLMDPFSSSTSPELPLSRRPSSSRAASRSSSPVQRGVHKSGQQNHTDDQGDMSPPRQDE